MTKIDQKKYYEDTIGRIPPEISDRIDVGLQADPKLTENVRGYAHAHPYLHRA